MKQQGAELSQRNRHVWRAIGRSRPLVTKTKTNVQPKGPRSRHVWRAIERSHPLLTKNKNINVQPKGSCWGRIPSKPLQGKVEHRTRMNCKTKREENKCRNSKTCCKDKGGEMDKTHQKKKQIKTKPNKTKQTNKTTRKTSQKGGSQTTRDTTLPTTDNSYCRAWLETRQLLYT